MLPKDLKAVYFLTIAINKISVSVSALEPEVYKKAKKQRNLMVVLNGTQGKYF